MLIMLKYSKYSNFIRIYFWKKKKTKEVNPTVIFDEFKNNLIYVERLFVFFVF